VKTFKQLNNELSEKCEQLERLVEKSNHKDSNREDELVNEMERERNNVKVNVDMWKLKFSEYVPELKRKQKEKITSYDQLLSVIEQQLLHTQS
jgi:hypothetical protein